MAADDDKDLLTGSQSPLQINVTELDSVKKAMRGMPQGLPPSAAGVQARQPAGPLSPPTAAAPDLSTVAGRLKMREGDADSLMPEIMRRYQGIQQGYAGEQKTSSALKDLLTQTAQRIQTAQMGPTRTEAIGRMAGALGQPTGLGGIGAAFGNVGTAAAGIGKERREGELARTQLMAKYGIDANQADQMSQNYGIQAQQQGLAGLMTRYNGDQGAADRLATQGAAEANKERNAPVININGQPGVNQPLVDAKAAAAQAQQRGRNVANNATLTPDVIDTEATLARANGGKLDYAFVRNNPLAAPAIITRMAEMERAEGNEPGAIVFEGQANKARQAAANSWNSSSPTSGGTTIRRLGVTIGHMQVLQDYLQALGNGDSSMINRAKMAYQKEFNTSSVPATIDALTPILANEMIASINARGGTGHERDAATDALGQSRDFKTQADIMKGETRLLAGQLGGLKTQYEASGMKDVLGPFRGRVENRILRDPTLAASIGEAPETGAVHVHTPEEAALYPSGTELITPDGRHLWAK